MRFPISIYLSLPGLLLLAATASAETSAPIGTRIGSGAKNERVEYAGDIDGALQIQMTLCPDEAGRTATGAYFYEKYLEDIRITAQMKSGRIVIREFDPHGKPTGIFTGQFPTEDPRHHFMEGTELHGEVITGFWSKPDGTGSRPFYLHEISLTTAPLGAAYRIAGFTADAPVDAFASRFRKAVLAHDAKTVAASLHYPIEIAHEKFHSSKELREHFDAIFTPLLLQRMSRANPIHMFARDQGVMMGDGEAWIAPDEYGRPFIETINTDWPPELIAIDEERATGAGVTISKIHVVASRSRAGLQHFELSSAGKTVEFETERSAIVYIEAPQAQWVLIHDEFVSNEDSILIYDPSQMNLPPQVLAHDDTTDDYGHCHYKIERLADDGIQLTEDEWAGSKPARTRALTLRHGQKGFKLVPGPWTQSAP